MRLFAFSILALSISLGLSAVAGPADMDSELRRLEGFQTQQKAKEKFDEERLSGAPGLDKRRQAWDQSVESGIDDYKRWKAQQAEAPEDGSPEFLADQKRKKIVDSDYEQARDKYIKDRRKNSVELKRPISEAVEYGLVDTGERVDPSHRAMYNSKVKGLSTSQSGSGFGSGSSGGFSGGNSNPPPPPMDYGNSSETAPPISAEPEFYEPEIPPPPPPPDDAFDDAIPPPVFDDPEF